jgi:hypothetical protein
MPYTTNSAANISGLVDAINTFLSANGWTVLNTYADGPGGVGKHGIAVTDGAAGYFEIWCDAMLLYVAGSVSYTNTVALNAQPNQSDIGVGTQATFSANGPVLAYWLFAPNATDLYIVIRVATGVYTHLHFGTLAKYGTYTGGQWGTRSYWDNGINTYDYGQRDSGNYIAPYDYGGSNWGTYSGFVGAQVDGHTWWSLGPPLHGGSIYLPAYSIVRGDGRKITDRSPNAFNQEAVFANLPMFVLRPTGLWTPVGEVKDCRSVNIHNYNSEDIITIGTDNWQVFPLISKLLTTRSSQDEGLAIRRA